MPDAMVGITPPPEFTWIGSRTSELSGAIAAFRFKSAATASYKTELSPIAASEAIASWFFDNGWQRGLDRSPSRGAFVTSSPTTPELYCMTDRSMNVSIDEVDDTTYVSFAVSSGQGDSACTATISLTGSEYMPRLAFPRDPVTGVPVVPDTRGSTVEIRHGASLSELTTALAQQLVEQGWTNDATWTGATTAGSSWARRAADGTEVLGTLDITDTGEATYNVMFRVVSLSGRSR
jgi:hypothetical protein